MLKVVRSCVAGEQGHSLLEAVISLGLFLILMTVVLSIYAPSRVLHARSEQQTDVQQNARLAMAEISRSVRNAGYFPENFTTVTGADVLSDPILVATDRALAIHGDVEGSGVSSAFMFCTDGDTLRRTRAETTSGGAYTCGAGEPLAENVAALRFTYFDGDGNAIPDPLTSAYALDDQVPGAVPSLDDMTHRGSVRRIVITLSVAADSIAGKTQQLHLTSDVVLRNAS